MTNAAQTIEAERAKDVKRRWLLSAPALVVLIIASIGPLFIVLLFIDQKLPTLRLMPAFHPCRKVGEVPARSMSDV